MFRSHRSIAILLALILVLTVGLAPGYGGAIFAGGPIAADSASSASEPDSTSVEARNADRSADRQRLVASLESLKHSVLLKIDVDTRSVADSFGLLASARELTPWWRELLRATLDTVEAVVSTISSIVDVLGGVVKNVLVGDPQVLRDFAAKANQLVNSPLEQLGFLSSFQSLIGLFTHANEYKIFVRDLSDIEESARIAYNLRNSLIDASNIAYRRLWIPKADDSMKILLRLTHPDDVNTQSRAVTSLTGTRAVSDSVESSFDNLISQIPDPIPQRFPVDEIVSYLEGLRSEVIASGRRDIQLKSAPAANVETTRQITLGMVQEGRAITNKLYDAWSNGLKVQQIKTFVTTGSIIVETTDLYLQGAGKIGTVVEGVSDMYGIAQLAVYPEETLKVFDQTTPPLDALQIHVSEMTYDLVHEASNVWSLSEETIRYIRTQLETHSEPVEPTQLPDLTLIPPNVTVSQQTVHPGDTIDEVGFTLANTGNVASGPFTVRISLSPTSKPYGVDHLIEYIQVGSINAGGRASYTPSITIPAHIAVGNYYLTVWADAYQTIIEPENVGLGDGNNNIGSTWPKTLSIIERQLPDLVVTAVNTPETVRPGDAAKVNFTILNRGEADTSGFFVKAYLGMNPGGFSYGIGETQAAPIRSGDSTQLTIDARIPSPVTGGDYWISVLADSDDVVDESSETNNLDWSAVTVDSGSPGTIQFGSGSFPIDESSGEVLVSVLRQGGASGAVSVDVATIAGTAIANVDYLSFSKTITLVDGQTSSLFTVKIIDDSSREGDEVFNLQLSNPSGGVQLGSLNVTTVTIKDDDTASGPVTVTASSPADNATGLPTDSVTLSWKGNHPGGEQLSYTVYVAFSDIANYFPAHIVSAGQTEQTYTVTNPPYDTTVSWGIKAADESGDYIFSPMFHFKTRADESAPSGFLNINNGAPTTDSYKVTLYLSASDSGSGVARMRFSNDGETWAMWQPFAETFPWNISDWRYGGRTGQQEYTVYAQVVDEQNNISSTFTDTITKIDGAPGRVILNGNEYETIRDAVEASASGDTIFLTEGIYVVPGQVAPPRYPNQVVGIVMKPGTKLVGAGADRTKIVSAGVILFTIADADDAVIEGLTIVMSDSGGVRYAVKLESKGSELRDSVIDSVGDAVLVEGENIRIVRNIIRDSQTGIWIMSGGNIQVLNNTVVRNVVNGISGRDVAGVTVANNILAFNQNFGIDVPPNYTFTYNNVFSNDDGNYSTFDGRLLDQTGSNGNVSVDPKLDSSDRASPGSPMIDAGINVGLAFKGAAPDIGAHEVGAVGTLQVVSNRDDASFAISGPRGYIGTGRAWSVSDAPVGAYTVSFRPISDLNTPPLQIINLLPQQVAAFDGNYTPDATGPTGNATINFGEYSTAHRSVALTLDFQDVVAGMGPGAQMRFSNNGANWSTPEDYSTVRKNWMLAPPGNITRPTPVTVFVMVSDALGNWSESIRATIVYAPDSRTIEVPLDYATIQEAVDAALPGDTVWVAPGNYNESIKLTDGVRLQGAGSHQTTIVASGSPWGIQAADNTQVDGFTIRASWPVVKYEAKGGATVIISNNILRGSRGVQITDSNAIIRNNLILSRDPSNPELRFAVLVSNSKDGPQTVSIENNTIVGSLEYGILLSNVTENTRIEVRNNIFAEAAKSAINDDSRGDPNHQHVFSSFNLFSDIGEKFEGVKSERMGGVGDFTISPQFVDPTVENYQLMGSSPAANSGHPAERYQNADGTRNDRGAFGGLSLNTPPVARLRIPSQTGPAGMLFEMDASESLDAQTSFSALMFRWDFDGDGLFDTLFESGNARVSHQFDGLGSYNPRVQVKDQGGFSATASGQLSVLNSPPDVPGNPFSNDGAATQTVETVLSWSGTDADSKDTLEYDVYFGTANPPPLVVQGTRDTQYDAGTLSPETRYYWKVVVSDGHGSIEGPVWSFETIQDKLTLTEPVGGQPNPAASADWVSMQVKAVDSLSHALSYAWSAKCDGLSSNGAFNDARVSNPIWTAPTNRTGATQKCTITVEIDDSSGSTLSQGYTHFVRHELIAPTVELKVSSSTVLNTVDLVAEAADEDGTIDVYQWDFDGDGVIDATSTSPSTSFTYDRSGIYDIIVIAVDKDGQTAVAVGVFTLNEPCDAWDINCDGKVNVLDMISIGQDWGAVGPPGWLAEDVNEDGKINVLDMIIVGQHWKG